MGRQGGCATREREPRVPCHSVGSVSHASRASCCQAAFPSVPLHRHSPFPPKHSAFPPTNPFCLTVRPSVRPFIRPPDHPTDTRRVKGLLKRMALPLASPHGTPPSPLCTAASSAGFELDAQQTRLDWCK